MTFEERVDEEVNKRMAKRLLQDEEYRGSTFILSDIEMPMHKIEYMNQNTIVPSVSNDFNVKMSSLDRDAILYPGTYLLIRLDRV